MEYGQLKYSKESPLDLAAALELMGNDRELYESVLETYLESFSDIVTELVFAAEHGDMESVTRCAHSIKSTSRTVGGMRLGDVAAQLEACGKSASRNSVTEYIEIVKREFEVLLDHLATEGFDVASGKDGARP